MSMLDLGNHHAPRGDLSSPLRRAIVAYLKANEPTSVIQLHQHLLASFGHTDDETCSRLRRNLYHLEAGGHAHRIDVDGERRWTAGPAPIATGAAPARQVVRLDQSVYVPTAGPALRPGAADFTRIPSVLLGRRTDYRSSLQ